MNSHRPVSPCRLLVRCFAERKGDQWQAFTLELGLAVQGDSFPDVKHRLEQMISAYVYDALVGQDRDHAAALLSRKATWRAYLRYYAICFRHQLGRIISRSKDALIFSEPLPLEPRLAN